MTDVLLVILLMSIDELTPPLVSIDFGITLCELVLNGGTEPFLISSSTFIFIGDGEYDWLASVVIGGIVIDESACYSLSLRS